MQCPSSTSLPTDHTHQLHPLQLRPQPIRRTLALHLRHPTAITKLHPLSRITPHPLRMPMVRLHLHMSLTNMHITNLRRISLLHINPALINQLRITLPIINLPHIHLRLTSLQALTKLLHPCLNTTQPPQGMVTKPLPLVLTRNLSTHLRSKPPMNLLHRM